MASPHSPGNAASWGIISSVKIGEVLRILKADGWIIVRTKGSHRHLKHPLKSGTVTVAGKPSMDMNPDTLRSIFKQASLDLRKFR